ncbi:SMI1/KNR4 family protein [Pelagibius sp. Alg239-R121]|uniref:SMI1/KNR4 family protein n=1 Tax=Pelagibius sp. Alg239-R121 TaxID=2993448 RepID=UPI0024A666DA|nr:SMI1/KNR4 family protein [Pelagibius sp. Alg239-R121]
MTVEIVKRGPVLTEEKLANFENNNQLKLPEDYKSFMLQYNGGKPVPCDFPLIGHREESSDVVVFYGVDYELKALELQKNFDSIIGYFADPAFDKFFPIANDSFNDLICLDLSDEHYGAVVFIDRVPMWKDYTAKEIYVIADSFSAFLDMLYEVEYDD